jgi:uncharacterized hydrophobic protein (TIGR00271 family)
MQEAEKFAYFYSMSQFLRKNPSLLGPVRFLKDRFDLSMDKADELQTIDYVRKNVEFKGANLWILIFAIFVASVGLNVNAPAVIIGAMLISPLMGPIIGVGMGVGINDFELIKKSLKNLAVAIIISVLTSALYFYTSPLSDAQSELLARTNPTIWDVLIALFGGFAGIVAGSSKEKSNAIPGVAIATALMPPLCTAGFGLATGNFFYFLGAFYLFFINSVFISLSTFLMVRFLKYPKKEFVDPLVEKRVKTSIALFVIITIVPSVFLGVQVVRESIFERNANLFIQKELSFEGSRVISTSFDPQSDPPSIEISLYGEKIEQNLIDNAIGKQNLYGLDGATIRVFQGYDKDNTLDLATVERMNLSLRSGIIEDLYKRNEDLLANKDAQIQLLEGELMKMKSEQLPIDDLAAEIKALNSSIQSFTIHKGVIRNFDQQSLDTTYLAYLRFKQRISTSERKKLEEWLQARLKSSDLKLIIE